MKDKIQNDKQPFENFEELSCDIIDRKEFEDETKNDKDYLLVFVDVFVGKDLGEEFNETVKKLNDAFVARTTKRGTRFYAGDIEYSNETGIIKFQAGTSVPENYISIVKYIHKKMIGTTFADFCFLSSDGTKFHTVDQCSTPFREDCEPGDLTWLLPAKFVDDMVEIMNVKNNHILCGTMQEAIIYGPKLI